MHSLASTAPSPPSRLNESPLQEEATTALIKHGDVVYFHHLNASGFIATRSPSASPVDPDGCVVWLDEPTTEVGDLSREEVERRIEAETAIITARGFESVHNLYAKTTHDKHGIDPRSVTPTGAPDATCLSLRIERGTGAKSRLNGFLKHHAVDYDFKVQKGGYKVGFSACFDGRPVAIAVLDRPAPALDNGRRLQISRMAAHRDRPANVCSWLLSRVCDWAYLTGYDEIYTYAGVMNENTGTAYRAAGFEFLGTEENADGDEWECRENRTGHGTFRKHRYRKRLAEPTADALLSRNRTERRIAPSKTLDESQTYLAEYATDETARLCDLTLTREEPLNQGDSADVIDFFSRCGISETDLPEPESIIAVFGARHQRRIRAAAIVTTGGQPATQSYFGIGHLTHLAVGDVNYPDNICRWLASQIRNWANLHGLEGLISYSPTAGEASVYSGMDVNPGTVPSRDQLPESLSQIPSQRWLLTAPSSKPNSEPQAGLKELPTSAKVSGEAL